MASGGGSDRKRHAHSAIANRSRPSATSPLNVLTPVYAFTSKACTRISSGRGRRGYTFGVGRLSKRELPGEDADAFGGGGAARAPGRGTRKLDESGLWYLSKA